MRSSCGATLLLLLGSSLAGEDAAAQSLASPFATVSQKVDSTTISIEYYRPSLRGRAIFGKLVRWGAVWTPGANWATTLEVDRDIRIEGQPLPKGKYSLWLIPAAPPDSWTVILSRAARRFHVVHPVASDDQLRFKVATDSAAPLELLTFSFPVVSRSGATLQLHWAETTLGLALAVEPTRPRAVAAHPLSSYTGSYELRWESDPSRAIRYEVVERDNALWVRTGQGAVEEGLDVEFDLQSTGRDEFHPRQYKNGKLVGTELDELIVFQVEGNRATGFELRGIAEAKLLARGTRVP